MGLTETREAIAAATKAFKTWSKTTAKVRILFAEMVSSLDVIPCLGAP